MTKRERFAMAAMQALLSNPSIVDCDTDITRQYVSGSAWDLADAVLSEAEGEDHE